jgi:zinc D-Ala-D-Ala carboxypeptidase
MKLSKNFTMSELTRSSTAKRKGINNDPSEAVKAKLRFLVNKLLQPMRDKLGPIRVTSGYRSPKLNRAIGGSTKSQHCKGEAVDLQFVENGLMRNKKIYDYLIENEIEFDQLINEFDFSWIHVSIKKKGNRNRILEAYKDEDGDTCYKEIKPTPVL